MAGRSTASSAAARLLLVILAALILFALITYYNRRKAHAEAFNAALTPLQASAEGPDGAEGGDKRRAPADAHAATFEEPRVASTLAGTESPLTEQCRDVAAAGDAVAGAPTPADSSAAPGKRLSAEELLPKDAANSKWAQVNPAGQGDVQNRNFLTAGYHLGVDTQGSSLRNPSHDLRSTPANPRMRVSIWNQSDIEPDMNRRPLE